MIIYSKFSKFFGVKDLILIKTRSIKNKIWYYPAQLSQFSPLLCPVQTALKCDINTECPQIYRKSILKQSIQPLPRNDQLSGQFPHTQKLFMSLREAGKGLATKKKKLRLPYFYIKLKTNTFYHIVITEDLKKCRSSIKLNFVSSNISK